MLTAVEIYAMEFILLCYDFVSEDFWYKSFSSLGFISSSNGLGISDGDFFSLYLTSGLEITEGVTNGHHQLLTKQIIKTTLDENQFTSPNYEVYE